MTRQACISPSSHGCYIAGAQKWIAAAMGICLAFLAVDSILTAGPAQAQVTDLSVVTFTARDGLPNNLTKFAIQDSTGFIWIGTDGGLVRFDGANFRTYTTSDGLPDNYVKFLFADRQGTVNVVTDGGVVSMKGTYTTPSFSTVLPATKTPTDSSAYYPKTMYRDRQGRLWVADAMGLYRVDGQYQKRYALPQESWPDSFTRTYSLAEDEHGFLVVASERGQIFVYNEIEDRFSQISDGRLASNINAVLPSSDGSLWFGGADGVHALRLTQHGTVASWEPIEISTSVNVMLATPDGDVLLGTSDSGLKILQQHDVRPRVSPYVELGSGVVNHVAYDREGNLLVSTDNGFALVRRQFFSSVLEFNNTAIESLSSDRSGRIFVVKDRDVLEIVGSGKRVRTQLLFSADEVLTAVASDGTHVWAGTRTGSVYRYSNGEKTLIPLRGKGAVSTMTTGNDGEVWLAHFKQAEVTRVSRDGSVRVYGPGEGVAGAINVVRFLESGLFAGSDGKAYLLKYVPDTDRFSDVSHQLLFEPHSDLQVFDVDISNDGRLWLASDRGLLTYDAEGVRRFESEGQLSNEEIRALAHDSFGNVWVGSGRGLYRVSRGQVTQFNRDAGLVNLTMTPRSLVLDRDERLWVGHYSGVSQWSRKPGEVFVTPPPIELDFRVDSAPLDKRTLRSRLPFNSFVEIEFIALSHPGDNILYQVRTIGTDEAWSAPSRKHDFSFSHVREGAHGIEVRAQQDGYVWSVPAAFQFEVSLPWYRRWWAFIIFLAAGVGLMYVMTESHNVIRTRQLKAQTTRLEKRVRERTRELMIQKSIVEQANAELKAALEQNHEFIGIAAHDLRNPLTSLVGFSEMLIDGLDKCDPEEYRTKSRDVLPIIHRAATTMHGVIQDMLDSQLVEGGTDRLRPEMTDLVELTRSVINMNASPARRKGISVMFNPKGIFRAWVDARGMQRVLDNLISNALKYSPPSSNVTVKLTHSEQGIRIAIQDEGPGLTLDDRERVFRKLQRLSAKPTGGEMSTGLGLYIVRSIVEMHNGTVGVDSEPGEGAEFWVEIPSGEMRAAA